MAAFDITVKEPFHCNDVGFSASHGPDARRAGINHLNQARHRNSSTLAQEVEQTEAALEALHQ